MGGQDDLRASLEALVVPRRDRLGGPATPEELIAWRDDALDEEERRRIGEKIAADPDAARALADLAAFPEVAPAPGTTELSDEDVDAHWQAFRAQLAELPPPPMVHRTPESAPAPRAAKRELRAARPSFRWQQAAAALVLLSAGVAGGFLAGRSVSGGATDGSGAINVEIVELQPAGEGGARAAPVEVKTSSDSEGTVLILGTRDHTPFPAYRVEMIDLAGARVWERRGLRPTPLGTFQLAFPRGALAPGDYRIYLQGLDGRDEDRPTPLAAYDLHLRAEAP